MKYKTPSLHIKSLSGHTNKESQSKNLGDMKMQCYLFDNMEAAWSHMLKAPLKDNTVFQHPLGLIKLDENVQAELKTSLFPIIPMFIF